MSGRIKFVRKFGMSHVLQYLRFTDSFQSVANTPYFPQTSIKNVFSNVNVLNYFLFIAHKFGIMKK
jgi:hypothetical protein